MPKYAVVSGDSHLEISPDRWTPRVPAKFRERAPRLIKLHEGGDAVVIENRPLYVVGLALAGLPYDQHSPLGMSYEGAPGAGSPEERLKEQGADGVDAEILFTSSGNASFWRGISDDAAYKAVIHAYNEFLVEDYCSVAPDRLVAMGIMPETSVDDAVAELEYCARAGLKGVALNAFPSGKSFPLPEDDRFWAAALDLNMAVTVHVAMRADGNQVFKYKQVPAGVTVRGDPIRQLMRFGLSAANAVQMVMAEVFERFPRLQVYFAETMIGWIPYAFAQVDDIYERSKYWAERLYSLEPLPRRPSEYLAEHCYWGFLRDPVGVQIANEHGIEKAMWGNDFPHSAGDWPHSQELIDEMFATTPPGQKHRFLAGNAVEFFHLKES
jgi:predicted TIM-barrel fold metal-dependent hydrolase